MSEVSKYDDLELLSAYQNCLDAEKKREEASQHDKFNKDGKKPRMEFPPINPNFIILKNELEQELIKRKLK